MKQFFLATAFAALPFAALASDAAETYVLDPSHSQVVFTYSHLGYSTTYGMFSGFDGQIAWDKTAPENSTVTVSFPVRSMLTGWEARFEHFMTADFFGADADEMVTFTSTGIEVTGETTAIITGGLTLNGVTKSVALDANLNQSGDHPMEGKPWAGFDATTTLVRSDYDLGMFAPYVSDEVQVMISVEAMKAE
ncbi:YceI family protein [Antarctobacter heliothermus]|uniref:Polyisoprenoid-binding protein YceI n=1 Tax=Antarctobacter heliothermus TaxID=74033 RepID=A0A239GRR2_9RHOB|nr:YceI family protein [Antarctobacter heliothermus]SNS71183.1 Polyisoprenoid-binding protein YceI [Antarctobacter heliothermus]